MQRVVGFVRGRRPVGLVPTIVVALVALPLIGLALVFLADLVPDRWVLDSLVDAIERGQLTAANYGPATSGRFMDYFTDCIGATIGLGDQPGTTHWSAGVRSPTLGNCGRAVPAIEGWVEGDGLLRNSEYFRYWHGYAVLTRPAIAIVGLAGTRMIMFVGLLVASAGFARSLWRQHGSFTAAALLGPVLLTTDLFELPRSLPHAAGALAAITTAWWLHTVAVVDPSPSRVAGASIVAGATFLFFDILTIAPGAWALAVAAVALGATRSATGRRLAGLTAFSAACWIVGWAWMWASKWGFAVVLYGFGRVRDDVGDAADARLGGEVEYLDLGFSRSTRRLVSTWWDHPLATLILCGLLGLVVVVWIRRPSCERAIRWTDRLVIAAVALVPVVWFETLRNHSQVHAGFTYRSVAVIVGVIAAALVVPLPRLDDTIAGPDDDAAGAAVADDGAAVDDGAADALSDVRASAPR